MILKLQLYNYKQANTDNQNYLNLDSYILPKKISIENKMQLC